VALAKSRSGERLDALRDPISTIHNHSNTVCQAILSFFELLMAASDRAREPGYHYGGVAASVLNLYD
jgi:hypothetical protein